MDVARALLPSTVDGATRRRRGLAQIVLVTLAFGAIVSAEVAAAADAGDAMAVRGPPSRRSSD